MEKLCRYVIIICLLENSGILSVSKADTSDGGTAMAMTWQGLADFINNEMPECNRNEEATVWDAGESGKFCYINDITPYDMYESSNEDNFYSVNINADEDYWV